MIYGGIEYAYHTNVIVLLGVEFEWPAIEVINICVVAPWVNWQIVLMFDKERFIKGFCGIFFSVISARLLVAMCAFESNLHKWFHIFKSNEFAKIEF